MKILLNNRETELPEFDEISVSNLLEHVRYVFHNIVVKVNGKLVKKSERDKVIVKNDDVVEAIHMISGG